MNSLWRRTMATLANHTLNIDTILPCKRFLSPAETALMYRIKVTDIPENIFKASLSHPRLPQSKGANIETFQRLEKDGNAILEIFIKDFINTRIPKLPQAGIDMAMKIFSVDRNLSTISKSFGLDYALIEWSGIPCIKRSKIEDYIGKTDEEAVDPMKIYSSIFKSLLGAIFSSRGALRSRDFLDSYLFSASFPLNLLYQPHNPIIKLNEHMIKSGKKQIDYRLLHESGRLSNSSVYCVGAYCEYDMISESSGPSLLIAQERAAMDALRKIYLVQDLESPRLSDSLVNKAPVMKIEQLKKILKFK